MARTASPTKPANGTGTGTTNGQTTNGHGQNGNGNGKAGVKQGSGYRQLTPGAKPGWKGVTIERRDQVRIACLPPDAVAFATLRVRLVSTYGPFRSERAITSSLAA